MYICKCGRNVKKGNMCRICGRSRHDKTGLTNGVLSSLQSAIIPPPGLTKRQTKKWRKQVSR